MLRRDGTEEHRSCKFLGNSNCELSLDREGYICVGHSLKSVDYVFKGFDSLLHSPHLLALNRRQVGARVADDVKPRLSDHVLFADVVAFSNFNS